MQGLPSWFVKNFIRKTAAKAGSAMMLYGRLKPPSLTVVLTFFHKLSSRA
jgi:hypothetical protein